MKKATLYSIFWIILIVSFVFMFAYFFTKLNIKNAALMSKSLNQKVKETIPVYDLRDVSYSESGTVAELTFDLVNMGDPIMLKGWLLEFLTPDGSTICRTTVFTGDPTESSRLYTEVYLPSENKTLSYGDAIPSGDLAEVTMTLLVTCLNQTIDYARNHTKMVVRLTIPPTGASAILRCSVDPYTGFATCTQS